MNQPLPSRPSVCHQHSGMEQQLKAIRSEVCQLRKSVNRWTWAVIGAMGSVIVLLVRQGVL